MNRPTQRSTRTYPLFPYTTLCRSFPVDTLVARDQRLQRMRGEVVGTDLRQCAAVTPDRRADRVAHESLGHGVLRIWISMAAAAARRALPRTVPRSEEHTSELQSLMRISYDVLCLTTKTKTKK